MCCFVCVCACVCVAWTCLCECLCVFECVRVCCVVMRVCVVLVVCRIGYVISRHTSNSAVVIAIFLVLPNKYPRWNDRNAEIILVITV